MVRYSWGSRGLGLFPLRPLDQFGLLWGLGLGPRYPQDAFDDSICGSVRSWDAYDDSICGSVRSWFTDVDSICGREGAITAVRGDAGDDVTDGIG